MINLNGNDYLLCLLDTNVIYEIVKRPEIALNKYLNIINTNAITCLSLFTILELRKWHELYEKFLITFSNIPCIIVKNIDQLCRDEVLFYPNHDMVSPILFGSLGLLSKKNETLADVFTLAFQNKENQILENKWIYEKNLILSGVLNLFDQYKPKNKKFTSKEIRTFIEIAGYAQIAARDLLFARKIANKKEVLQLDAFPSVKMFVYNIFYKFFTDDRLPQESDAFDVLIASSIPYVDIFITEKHQAETIKKIKTQDIFLQNLSVLRLSDIL